MTITNKRFYLGRTLSLCFAVALTSLSLQAKNPSITDFENDTGGRTFIPDKKEVAITSDSPLGIKTMAFAGPPRIYYYAPGSFDIANNTVGSSSTTSLSPILASRDVTFNDDGSIMYVISENSDIFSYALGTPFDPTSYTSGASSVLDVSAQEIDPQSLLFNDDGTVLYVMGFNGDDVNQYPLPTAFDISSYVSGTTSVAKVLFPDETVPTDMIFNGDGTKFFVVGTTGDDVTEYNLSTPYDVSTAGTGTSVLSMGTNLSGVQSIEFNRDGTLLYLLGENTDRIIAYPLNTPFDPSSNTVGFTEVLTDLDDSVDARPRSMVFNDDGSSLFVLGGNGNNLVEFPLLDINPNTGFAGFNENQVNDGSIDNSAPLILGLVGDTYTGVNGDDFVTAGKVVVGNLPAGLTAVVERVSDTELEVTLTGNATDNFDTDDVAQLTFAFTDAAFNTNSASGILNSGSTTPYDAPMGVDFIGDVPELSYFAPGAFDLTTSSAGTEAIDVGPEELTPRGMTFNGDGTILYVIGTNGDDVNAYPLSTPYDLSSYTSGVSTPLFVGGEETIPVDLLFNGDGTKLYVLGDSGNDITEYSLNIPYDLNSFNGTKGVAFSIAPQESVPTSFLFNDDGSQMFMIGTSGDDINVYNLSTNYDISTAVFDTVAFSIAGEDSIPGDLEFNIDGTVLYMVGKSSKKVYAYPLSVPYDPTSYTTGVSNVMPATAGGGFPEGLLFNELGNTLYILDSTDDNIFAYGVGKKNENGVPSFVENGANDGSINPSFSLNIEIQDDTFTGANGSDFVSDSKVTIGNVPSGLTPVLTKESDSRLKLTFTGNADSNFSTDDITNLTFSFVDAAFNNYPSSIVINSGDPTVYDSNIGINFFGDLPSLTYVAAGYFDPSTFLGSKSNVLDLSSEGASPKKLLYNNDGTILYVLDDQVGEVNSYPLTVPYDISSYTSGTTIAASLSGSLSSQSMGFNADGTSLYVLSTSSRSFYELPLATPYDVSTFVNGTERIALNTTGTDTTPTSFLFNNDGSKLYLMGNSLDNIYEYPLSVAYDISSAGTSSTIVDLTPIDNNPYDMVFNQDGTELLMIGDQYNTVISLPLSTPYDIASYTSGSQQVLDVTSDESSPSTLLFNNDGSKLYVTGNLLEDIFSYNLGDPINGKYGLAAYREDENTFGAIDNSKPLTIVLNNDAYTGNNGDDFVADGKVVVGNVPTGLTAVVERTSPTTLVLTFTGIAEDNFDVDDVERLTFSFTDDAFVVDDAARVTNSGDSTPFESTVGIDFIGAIPELTYLRPGAFDPSQYAGGARSIIDITSDVTQPSDMIYNGDGTVLYVLDKSADDITAFPLSVPYDISSYTSGASSVLAIGSQETSPEDIIFSPDGLTLYLIGTTGDDVNQYPLSIPFDISSYIAGSTSTAFSVGSEETTPRAFLFNNDGTQLFVMGGTGRDVNVYNLSVPYNMSTAVYDSTPLAVNTFDSAPQDMQFNNDGSILYVLGATNDDLIAFPLDTPYDLSSNSTGGSVVLDLTDFENIPYTILFNEDGSSLYVLGQATDEIFEFPLGIKSDSGVSVYRESATDDGSIDNRSPLFIDIVGEVFSGNDGDDFVVDAKVIIGEVPEGLTPVLTKISDTQLSLTFTGNAVSNFTEDDIDNLTFEFDNTAFVNYPNTTVINSGATTPYDSNVGIDFFGDKPKISYLFPGSYDPSSFTNNVFSQFVFGSEESSPTDMKFNKDGTVLYVIGSSSDTVYAYPLDRPFNPATYVDGVTAALDVSSEESTPREIMFNPTGTILYVLGSQSAAGITAFPLQQSFDPSSYAGGASVALNVSGEDTQPTSMMYNQDGTVLYVLGSTGDDITAYTLDVPYDISTNSTAATLALDVSGEETTPLDMMFSNNGSELFLIGGQGDDVTVYPLATPYDISSFTGIASTALDVSNESTNPAAFLFNEDGGNLLVMDFTGKDVHQYALAENVNSKYGLSAYPEVIANDGSLDNSNPLVLDLSIDTYTGTNGDDFITEGLVEIPNLPDGLTASLIRLSDTRLELTLTGNAIENFDRNDLRGLEFVFADEAFTAFNALQVANSGSQIPYASPMGIDFIGDNAVLEYTGPGSFDPSTYNGGVAEVLDVGSQESFPNDMLFNNDGTVLYVLGQSGDDVNAYALATPFDISSATGSTSIDLLTRRQDGTPKSLLFNGDGSVLYVLGDAADEINAYPLDVPYDVSSYIFGTSIAIDVTTEENLPQSMLFNNDGTKLYIMGQSGDDVNAYNLSTAYDISTATFDAIALDFGPQESTPTDMAFNSDGSALYITGTNSDAVHEYPLPTPFDVSSYTIGTVQALDLGDQLNTPSSILFSEDGSELYAMGTSTDAIFSYPLGNANENGVLSYSEASTDDGSIDPSFFINVNLKEDFFTGANGSDYVVDGKVTIGNVPDGLTPQLVKQSDSSLKLTFTGNALANYTEDDIFNLTFEFTDAAFTNFPAEEVFRAGAFEGVYDSNFGIDFFGDKPRLTYLIPGSFDPLADRGITSIDLDVSSEDRFPNALRFNKTGTVLYVLGSTGDDINAYPLDVPFDPSSYNENGRIVLSVRSEETTPTDFMFNNDGSVLYLLGQSGDDITQYPLQTPFDISTYVGGASLGLDVGTEQPQPNAMMFNDDGTILYVMGETSDDITAYTLATAYDVSTSTGSATALDVSSEETIPNDFEFNNDGTALLVIGESSDSVHSYPLTVPYDISSYTSGTSVAIDVSGEERSPTSMVFNQDGTKLYVMGSTGDEINSYFLGGNINPKYGVSAYPETASDNGELDNSEPLVIQLSNETLTGADGSDYIADNKVTITNVPDGLTPVLTKTSDTMLTLTFTGNATSNFNLDDVANLNFVFDDSAFSTVTAFNVMNSGDIEPYESPMGIDFVGERPVFNYLKPGASALSTYKDDTSSVVLNVRTTRGDYYPSSMQYNVDGTKLYVFGESNDAILAYDLSTPYDISTRSLEPTEDLDRTRGVKNFLFNDDGTVMYTIKNWRFESYPLNVPYDVSSITAKPTALRYSPSVWFDAKFNDDGTKFYATDTRSRVREFPLTVPYDLGSYDENTNASSIVLSGTEINGARTIDFNTDGSVLYIGKSGSKGEVVQIPLAVPYDVSSADLTSSEVNFEAGKALNDVLFSASGESAYVLNTSGEIVEYPLGVRSERDIYSYPELLVNDGSMDNSLPMYIDLEWDMFTGADGSDFVADNKVVIGNVSPGLTPVLTKVSDTRLELTFTGMATDHKDVDDIDNLTFAFTDAALTNLPVSIGIRSGDPTPYDSNVGLDFFGTFAPGGVYTNLNVWFKADDNGGVTTDGGVVTSWVNQGDNLDATAVNSPTYEVDKQSTINFNPTIALNGTDQGFDLPDSTLSIENEYYNYFTVFKKPVTAGREMLLFNGEAARDNATAFYTDGANIATSFTDANLPPNYVEGTQELLDSIPTLASSYYYDVIENHFNGLLDGSVDPSTGKMSKDANHAIGYSARANTSFFEGNIAEIVAYKRIDSSPLDKQKIESYLAIKYGITLDQTTEFNYLDSDGNVIWNAAGTAANDFNHGIFGIGRDDESELHQRVSMSQEVGSLLTVALDDDFMSNNLDASRTDFDTNQTFSMFANNDGAITFSETEKPCICKNTVRLEREWQVQETGTVEDIWLSFNAKDLGLQGNREVYVITSSDSDFSKAEDFTYVKLEFDDMGDADDSNDVFKVMTDLPNGSFFTLAVVNSMPRLRHGKQRLFDRGKLIGCSND